MTDRAQWRYLIAGRIDDPLKLRTRDATVIIGFDRDGVGYGVPVPTAADGSFVTQALNPGTYMLALIRSPHAAAQAALPIALEVVRLGEADVRGVRLRVRRDVGITGRVRMEPDTPWPTAIVVTSCLETDGLRHADCRPAEGAPEGRFVLRNPFGPRVLRASCAGTGTAYNAPRVLLNGKDVTDVPTDFSADPAADLQLVFSRRR